MSISLGEDYAYIVMGAILILLGAVTINKILKGSKVPFALIMTTFTCLNGIVYIIWGTLDYIG